MAYERVHMHVAEKLLDENISDEEADKYLQFYICNVLAPDIAAKLKASREKGKSGWHRAIDCTHPGGGCEIVTLQASLSAHARKDHERAMLDTLILSGMVLLREEMEKRADQIAHPVSTPSEMK